MSHKNISRIYLVQIMAEEAKKEEKKGGFKPKKAEDKQELKKPQQQTQKKQIQIVRVAETDLDGEKNVSNAIRAIRGVSFMFANAISSSYPHAGKRVMDLSEDEIKQLEEFITHPEKHGIPPWMYNRRLDPDTGINTHLAVSHLLLSKTTDINKLKKMKCYKGVRHGLGLPVRGQRTRSSFRGKGTTVGVTKKKEQPAKASPAPQGKK